MSDVKHTPGPWMAAAKPSSIVGWPIVAASGRVIGDVAIINRRGDNTPKEKFDAYYAECKANAFLIAEAPNLLEQLRRVEHTLSVHGKIDADTVLHVAIRAALAKAEPIHPDTESA